MDDKLSIRINIADRYYPLKIDRNEEEKIRTATKIINETVSQYRTKYGGKDVQDFLAMVALQYATKVIDYEALNDNTQIIQDIKDMTHELDEYIKHI